MKSKIKTPLQSRLLAIRTETGWNNERLAMQLGISPRTLANTLYSHRALPRASVMLLERLEADQVKGNDNE